VSQKDCPFCKEMKKPPCGGCRNPPGPPPEVRCGECHSLCQLTDGEEIYPHRSDLFHKSFWICRACGAYCGCSGTTSEPLGLPAGAETRQARSRAHRAFDKLWKKPNGVMSRTAAYKWLASEMGITSQECHIGKMMARQAYLVVDLCKKWGTDTALNEADSKREPVKIKRARKRR
jgi:hypothetical protein